MPVLLLAQGDPRAKDMLRKAIDARYGTRPPVLESLKIQFKGRARAKIGPISSWVPLEVAARFTFPRSMRWDFIVRAVGVQLGSGVEAFDGVTYRTARGGKEATVLDNPETISSMQRRLWAVAAMLLTPLGEQFVKLEAQGDNILESRNTQIDQAVKLHLRPDHSLDSVEAVCLNPDTERQQTFRLQLSPEQAAIDDIMLPCKIGAFWDDDPYFEIEPGMAEANPAISESVYALESD